MSDLFRSFLGRGSDPENPPEASVEVLPQIVAMAEICRALSSLPAVGANPFEESNGVLFDVDLAAGGGVIDATLLTFSPGLWRLSIQASGVVTGAAPLQTNTFGVHVTRPSALNMAGLRIKAVTVGAVVNESIDLLLHIPTTGWSVHAEMADPVTALSVNRLSCSVYACRLI